MPCQYYLPGEEKAILRKELDRVTQLLCALMTAVESAEGIPMAVPMEVRAWWREHQERDRQREIDEANMAVVRQEAKQREIADLERKLAALKKEFGGD